MLFLAATVLPVYLYHSSVDLIAYEAFKGNKLTHVNFQGDYYGNFFSSTMFLANDQLDTITYCEGASNWDGVFFNIASAEDATEVAVTPVDCSLPSTPTIDSVTPGDRQVDIAFTPTAGAQVTDYQYRLDDGFFISAGISSPFTITELINGKDYSIVIRAVNVEDVSVPSDTQTFTPDVLPGAPKIHTATPGDNQVEVAFSPGSGERISDYQYRLDDGFFISAGTSSPFRITELINGKDYSIVIRAVNTAGNSAESNTLVFTPKAPTRPGAPIILSVESGDGELRVRFSAPNEGGTSIKSYTVTCGSASASGTTSPITVSSLSNGVRYTCSVVATNAIGDSPASAVSEAVPEETSQTGLPMWLLTEALKVRDK